MEEELQERVAALDFEEAVRLRDAIAARKAQLTTPLATDQGGMGERVALTALFFPPGRGHPPLPIPPPPSLLRCFGGSTAATGNSAIFLAKNSCEVWLYIFIPGFKGCFQT